MDIKAKIKVIRRYRCSIFSCPSRASTWPACSCNNGSPQFYDLSIHSTRCDCSEIPGFYYLTEQKVLLLAHANALSPSTFRSVKRNTFCSGGVVSYSLPEGSEPSQGLWDSSYDGQRSQGELHNGLGRLIDGETGADNFRLDIGYGKGL